MVKQKLQEQMAAQQGGGGQQMSPEGAPMAKLGGNTPCYNCGGMYQDGGSALYSTQGQTLRNFTNTLANSSGWSPSHTVLPTVGPNNRGNGSRTPAGLPNLGRGLTIPMNFEDGGMYDDGRGIINKGPYEGRALVNAYAKGGAYANVPQHGRPQGPDDGTYYQSGYFAMGGEPCPDINMIRNEEGRCVCKPGFEADQMTGECYPIGEESPDDEANETAAPRPTAAGIPIPGGGFNAGFGLEGKNYNFNYGFGVGADMKSNVAHNLDFKIPKAFRVGVNSGELGIKGSYVPGKSWMGDISAGVPLSGIKGRGDLLKFTGGMGQRFNDPELNAAMTSGANDFMKVNSGKTPLNYNAGIEYLGKMFGEKGPNVKIKASYTKKNKFGGLIDRYDDGGFVTTDTTTLYSPLNYKPAPMLQESTLMQKPIVFEPRNIADYPDDYSQWENNKLQQMLYKMTPEERYHYNEQNRMGYEKNKHRVLVNKYGGLTKFVGGGMPEEQAAGQDQQQQIMQQVAQMLQQGAQPEQVLQQLVQMGMPQEQAQQLIQMIMQQMQGGGQQPPMKMGGLTKKKYKKGGEYEMSQSDIQDLIKKGYKIQYL